MRYAIISKTTVRRDNDDGSSDFIPVTHPSIREFEAWKMAGNVPLAEPLPVRGATPQVGFSNPEVVALAAMLQAKGLLSAGEVTAVTVSPVDIMVVQPAKL